MLSAKDGRGGCALLHPRPAGVATAGVTAAAWCNLHSSPAACFQKLQHQPSTLHPLLLIAPGAWCFPDSDGTYRLPSTAPATLPSPCAEISNGAHNLLTTFIYFAPYFIYWAGRCPIIPSVLTGGGGIAAGTGGRMTHAGRGWRGIEPAGANPAVALGPAVLPAATRHVLEGPLSHTFCT